MKTQLLFAAAFSALALGSALATTASAAHSDGGYICQTFNMAKATPPSTHCITWTKAAAAKMHAVNCDPSKMANAAMRAQCADLTASAEQPAPAPAEG